MITIAQARKIALSMPEAVEAEHMNHPDFRVQNKIFATLRPDDQISVVKIPVSDQTKLIEKHPKTFSLNGWSRQGYVNVHLQHVSATLFRELIHNSWRSVAPKSLLEQIQKKR